MLSDKQKVGSQRSEPSAHADGFRRRSNRLELRFVQICVNLWLIIMSDQPTVTDIFRRALEMRATNPNAPYKDVKARIVSEYRSGPFPSPDKLTIPEYDNITPEEDWTAGLPIVLRGIQNEDWNDLAQGIIISLDQVENYPKESGREDDPDREWRNRNKGIAEAEEKVLQEWMPAELMAMAQRNVKLRGDTGSLGHRDMNQISILNPSTASITSHNESNLATSSSKSTSSHSG